MFVSLSIYISQKLKYMDILLVILGVICLLVGLAGCFLPILPGPPVAYLALWLLHFTGYAEFTVTELVVWGLLVVLAQAMDYVTPMLGTKYSGGSKWGNWGCAVGTALGNLAGSFRGGFRWGTFGRQGVRRCVEGWFRGVRGFFIECRAEGYPLRLFYL